MEKEDKKVEESASEDKAEKVQESSSNKKSAGKGVLISIIVVVVLILGALEMSGTIDVIKNTTVATVNGEKISQADYDTHIQRLLASEQGQFIDMEDPATQEQVLNGLIDTRILLQEANSASIAVTDEEVEEQYQLILTRIGTATSTQEERHTLLLEELGKYGFTEETFRDNIVEQLLIERYFASQIDEGSLTTTEEDVAVYYEQLSASQEGIPELDEIRTELEEQITFQKRQQEASIIFEKLRQEADIVISE